MNSGKGFETKEKQIDFGHSIIGATQFFVVVFFFFYENFPFSAINFKMLIQKMLILFYEILN